jgi:hypothetical protein
MHDATSQLCDWLERNAHFRLSILATYLISEVRETERLLCYAA